MKKSITLPLLAIGALLAVPSCNLLFQQLLSPEERKVMQDLDDSKKWVEKIQESARTCSAMEWRGTTGWSQSQTYTYPISAQDTATIRKLLCEHLHAVKMMKNTPIPHAKVGDPGKTCVLHMLDAKGNIIYFLSHSDITSDAHADENGYYSVYLALPDAEYKIWQNLYPADLQQRHEAAVAEWQRWLQKHGD